MQHHHYQQADDLYRAQAALMQWVRIAGHRGYWHKGDIGHRLFNGCFGYDPAEMFRYWVDQAGEISPSRFCIHTGNRLTCKLRRACIAAMRMLSFSTSACAKPCVWQ